MGRYIHRLARELTGNSDPYQKVRSEYNAAAPALYPKLKQQVREADYPLEAAGLTRVVRVISNGGDAPGTLLEEVSSECRDEYRRADFVISKGQGNYETLSGERKRIFFLLMAKCATIARDIGYEPGSMVLVEGGS